MKLFKVFLFIILTQIPFAHAIDFESGEHKVSLLELYTSEGCSSCPPADRWLSDLKNHHQLWKNVVPVAFHVDYWDYIGWQDRFADGRYSQRQRDFAREQSLTTVYTPGFILNGKEWRRWRYFFDSNFNDNEKAPGNLKLSVNDKGSFSAELLSENTDQNLILNIAILGMELSSEVQRGENRGRKLQHDFVVLGLQQYRTDQSQKWNNELPVTKHTASNLAIAAWVSTENSLTPLQATGGYLN